MRHLREFKKIRIRPAQYAIYGSGPLAVRGIRKARDLDVVVKDDLYRRLSKKYREAEPGHIRLGKISIFSSRRSLIPNAEKVIDRAETIRGFRFIRLEDSIVWKRKFGRKKDLNDIKLIRKYLQDRKRKTKFLI